MQILIHVAATCALHVGLGCDLSIAHDHPLLSAIVSALVRKVGFSYNYHDVIIQLQSEGQSSGHLDADKCQQWLLVQLPHMFMGLTQWLCAILSTSSERAIYHLPVVDCKTERLLQLNILMWVLSCVLPTAFLGGVQSQSAAKKVSERAQLN